MRVPMDSQRVSVSAPDFKSLGITVFERGWLSSNCILLQGEGPSALVDSGYATHALQTVELVRSALGSQALDRLLNTHLHSDHCGGNHLLQSAFPNLETWIPPGLAPSVAQWDPVALTFEPTGQRCDPFAFQGLLSPNTSVRLGSHEWKVLAAKGHDPHSIVLFQPEQRVLISADALWQNGFGVVFPELEGVEAFEEVSATLDLIEQIAPILVIPGHGPAFNDVPQAIARARSRLASFVSDPEKHRRYALKVLLKFKLLEWQRVTTSDLSSWCAATSYIRLLASEGPAPDHSQQHLDAIVQPALLDMQKSGALRIEGDWILNC
jgi:glyoxylase-like metal-dependent hydrolase (beta-lactamase superfamily II)